MQMWGYFFSFFQIIIKAFWDCSLGAFAVTPCPLRVRVQDPGEGSWCECRQAPGLTEEPCSGGTCAAGMHPTSSSTASNTAHGSCVCLGLGRGRAPGPPGPAAFIPAASQLSAPPR